MAARRSRVISTRARIKMRRLLQHTETDMKPTMEHIAQMVLDSMQEGVPRDTGSLADALTAFVSKNGLRVEVGLRGKKKLHEFFYARFIEFGTKGHEIKPVSGKALSFDALGGDGEIFGAVDHPGQPARPFMQPAYDTNKDEILRMINAMVNEALEKAQR